MRELHRLDECPSPSVRENFYMDTDDVEIAGYLTNAGCLRLAQRADPVANAATIDRREQHVRLGESARHMEPLEPRRAGRANLHHLDRRMRHAPGQAHLVVERRLQQREADLCLEQERLPLHAA